MTRFSFGLGRAREENIPATRTFRGLSLATTSFNSIDLGSPAATRRAIICFQWNGSQSVSAVKLGGFDADLIGSATDGTYKSAWYWIDAGTGSGLESSTSANLTWTRTGSGSFSVAVWTCEHADYIQDIRFSSVTSNVSSLALATYAAQNGVLFASEFNLGSGGSWSSIGWTGATKDGDFITPGGYFESAASAAISDPISLKTITAANSPSTKGGMSVLSLGKGPYPSFEFTDSDSQNVSGTRMTSSGKSVGATSGDKRQFIVVGVAAGKSSAYTSVKCNGVAMHLVGQQQYTSFSGLPVSSCMAYLAFSELPDGNVTTADFEINMASGDADCTIAVGIVRGGAGVAFDGASSTESSQYNYRFFAHGPRLAVQFFSLPHSGSVTPTWSTPIEPATKDYENNSVATNDHTALMQHYFYGLPITAEIADGERTGAITTNYSSSDSGSFVQNSISFL